MIDNVNSQAFPIRDYASGLTKRELIAAMALQGMLANGFMPKECPQAGNTADYNYTKAAVKLADAILAELERKG